MNNKKLEKHIEHHISEQQQLWLAFLAVSGGSFALMFGIDNKFKLFVCILGFITSILLFLIYFNKSAYIDKLIEQLEGQKYE